MIDTAGTLCAAADTVKEEVLRASSPVRPTVSSPTPLRSVSRPRPRAIERIVVTDTIAQERPGCPENIVVLSAAQTLADSIRRIFADDSVSEIFAGENQLF